MLSKPTHSELKFWGVWQGRDTFFTELRDSIVLGTNAKNGQEIYLYPMSSSYEPLGCWYTCCWEAWGGGGGTCCGSGGGLLPLSTWGTHTHDV
jgi:hypothetical protein